MKTEFLQYFKSLGMTEPLVQRIETLLRSLERIVPNEEFNDVLVDEYLEENGTRIYESVRFYSEEKAAIIADFVTKDRFIVGGLEKELITITVEARDYDFAKATEKSRLTITGLFPLGTAVLKGSKENCDHVRDIYLKYYLTRLKPV